MLIPFTIPYTIPSTGRAAVSYGLYVSFPVEESIMQALRSAANTPAERVVEVGVILGAARFELTLAQFRSALEPFKVTS